jgi:SAM-dependent methyltransferase
MDVLLQSLINIGAVTFCNGTKRFYNLYSKSDADSNFETEVMGKSMSLQRQLFYTADSVREGRAVGLTKVLGNYESLYEARADIPELAQAWDPWMDLRSTHLAERLSFIYKTPSVVARSGSNSKSFNGRVLDWCGNDGKNAIRLAKSDPTMQLTVLDLPAQVAKAAAYIEEAGLSNQIDTKGVDLLDGDPTFEHKYDAVLMIHMLSEWPNKDVARFLKIVKSILKPGGFVVLFDLYNHHPVGDFTGYRPDPLNPIGWFPIYMLTSASHTSYPKTQDELAGMLKEAGYPTVTSFGKKDTPHFSLVASMPQTDSK